MRPVVKATVGAIIMKGDNILLAKRNHEPFRDFWCIPGGHIDVGETAKHAVMREVSEETGLAFKPNFLGYYDEYFPDIGWAASALIFYGTAEGELHRQDSEVKELSWFRLTEARSMELAFE